MGKEPAKEQNSTTSKQRLFSAGSSYYLSVMEAG